jgi:hypothetical protein
MQMQPILLRCHADLIDISRQDLPKPNRGLEHSRVSQLLFTAHEEDINLRWTISQ